MVKAIAEQRGWQHSDHTQLFDAVATIAAETGDEDIDRLFEVASILHTNFYEGWYADYATSRSSSTSCNRRSTSNGVAGGHRHPICQHHPRSQQFRTERPQGTKAGKWQSCAQTLLKTAPPQPNEIRTAKSAASGVPAVRAVILHK